ncbi:DUF2268 domain-containing protein [Caldibacillus lycopersici]|uniref:DUF2268 domain-containing protein n=1 Tax=Perspicuibacillus lycopersici TaxID=1325689 RepID=A0AAE3IQ18_9BACI|nr:DUF2268 domain-containing protein [Perspicuibacillus lycopersici]MCU9612443.1 DUF2268 domain-containing protein [Perspicuibacillus lycopersici]
MDDNFYSPEKICKQLKSDFRGWNENEIYYNLVKKGMYRPSGFTKKILDQLKKQSIWEIVESLEKKYRKLWNGPDIPIFIFPTNQTLFSGTINKNGFTFPDKLFLFLPDIEEKEVEALFVHEYHHACRMNKLNKPLEEYTLLDSLIMEGLAEQAVLLQCGREYVSKWNYTYSENELNKYWEKSFLPNLNIKISNRKHDDLLYGKGVGKPLLGYAMGYYLVEHYKKSNSISIQETLTLPAEAFKRT